MPPPNFETVYPKLNLSRFTRQVSAKTDNHRLKYATFSIRPTLGARASGGQRMKNGGKKMRRRMEEERGFSFVIPSPVLHPLTLCGSGTQVSSSILWFQNFLHYSLPFPASYFFAQTRAPLGQTRVAYGQTADKPGESKHD